MKKQVSLGSGLAKLPILAPLAHRVHQRRVRLKGRVLQELQRRVCPERRGFFDAPDLSEDDVFLVSYPRSGNTWLRCVIAHTLYENQQLESLRDLDLLVPDIHRGIPKNHAYSSPRVIKTHRPYPYRHERQRATLYKRIIYVVRHPFDVIRSYHHMTTELSQASEPVALNDFARQFAMGAIGPCNWQEHVFSWKAMANEIEILLIKYEDMRTDPAHAVQRLAAFLGRQITTEEAIHIAGKCSRREMVRLEKKGSLVSPSYNFIRREETMRTVQDELTLETKEMIRLTNNLAMNEFGYE